MTSDVVDELVEALWFVVYSLGHVRWRLRRATVGQREQPGYREDACLDR